MSGYRLVGSGLREQIQHYGRILDATSAKFEKLNQRHAKLRDNLVQIGRVLQQRGEDVANSPEVQKLLRAFSKLEAKMAAEQEKTRQLVNLIEQLQFQLYQEGKENIPTFGMEDN